MEPVFGDEHVRLYCGDSLAVLREMPEGSVQCVVTSPPYWGLRDYGVAGQLGLERAPEEYVGKMVEVFREVRRVLRGDGTLWVNLGDSYAGSMKGYLGNGEWADRSNCKQGTNAGSLNIPPARADEIGLKPKDLVGIPWRVAFALQADGWYLRSDIIWHKPNPMPESVTDRPTKAHEYVFLLTKSARYYYDAEAIKEPNSDGAVERFGDNPQIAVENRKAEGMAGTVRAGAAKAMPLWLATGRNARSVWTIPTQPYPEAHFATYPQELVRRCIAAGTRMGDTVLDPFIGSGTTAFVARSLQRKAIGIDLSPEYLKMAERRLQQTTLLLEAAG